MFTFGFKPTNEFQETGDCHNTPHLDWFPANEILAEGGFSDKQLKDGIEDINLGTERLSCIKVSTILDLINKKKFNLEEDLILAEKNHSDLVPSKYEGGLKLWECTHDVAKFLSPDLVLGKTVLDLGCGVGLLGILALRMGASSVFFQDYNVDVLRCVTKTNVQLNTDETQRVKCRFFSGDWASFADMCPAKVDLIVTSETIYNSDNHEKLHDTISRLLRPGGIALVGAKSYYFGVGGSMKQFENLVKEKGVFDVETVWKCTQGVQREIMKLKFKGDENSAVLSGSHSTI